MTNVRSISISIIFTLLSLALPLVFDLFFPAFDSARSQAVVPGQQMHSLEELTAVTREAERRLDAANREAEQQPKAQLIANIRRPYLWLAATPWLFFALFAKSKSPLVYGAALTFPAILVLFDLIFPVEILFYGIAVAAGFGMKLLVVKRGQARIDLGKRQ